MVRTSVTLTPNSFSSASRIWCLLASGCTSNVYSCRVLVGGRALLGDQRPHDDLRAGRASLTFLPSSSAPASSPPWSPTSSRPSWRPSWPPWSPLLGGLGRLRRLGGLRLGLRGAARASGAGASSASGSSGSGSGIDAGERALFHHHRVRPEDVVGRRLDVRHDLHGRQVAAAQVHVLVRAVGEHQDLLARRGPGCRAGRRAARSWGASNVEPLDHVERALARPRVERDLAGELLHLARDSRCGSRAAAGRRPCRRPASAAPGSSPAARGRCPSASTASGCRRRRSSGSSSPRCPGAGCSRNAFTAWCSTGSFTVPSN